MSCSLSINHTPCLGRDSGYGIPSTPNRQILTFSLHKRILNYRFGVSLGFRKSLLSLLKEPVSWLGYFRFIFTSSDVFFLDSVY